MLIESIVIVSHDGMVLQIIVHEEAILCARHAVVHPILVHVGIDAAGRNSDRVAETASPELFLMLSGLSNSATYLLHLNSKAYICAVSR